MIQRFIGSALGALVAFGILWLNHADATAWAIAVIVGALVSLFWPGIIGWYLARRSSNRREDQIEAEVARRVAEKTSQDETR